MIAMGRFGGRELGYASDADVLFVHDPRRGRRRARRHRGRARGRGDELRRLLARAVARPAAGRRRRPAARRAGRARWCARLASYARVLRALVAGLGEPGAAAGRAGGRRRGARRERFVALVDPLRYPAGGLDEAAVREIRRIKARVEAERLPRGADPRAAHQARARAGWPTWSGPCSCCSCGTPAELPGLRTTRTLRGARRGRGRPACSTPEQAEALRHAWRTASRVRNAGLLVRGRPGDNLPTDLRELSGVARVLGYPPGAAGTLVDDYRRATRRARTVVERVFYR